MAGCHHQKFSPNRRSRIQGLARVPGRPAAATIRSSHPWIRQRHAAAQAQRGRQRTTIKGSHLNHQTFSPLTWLKPSNDGPLRATIKSSHLSRYWKFSPGAIKGSHLTARTLSVALTWEYQTFSPESAECLAAQGICPSVNKTCLKGVVRRGMQRWRSFMHNPKSKPPGIDRRQSTASPCSTRLSRRTSREPLSPN